MERKSTISSPPREMESTTALVPLRALKRNLVGLFGCIRTRLKSPRKMVITHDDVLLACTCVQQQWRARCSPPSGFIISHPKHYWSTTETVCNCFTSILTIGINVPAAEILLSSIELILARLAPDPPGAPPSGVGFRILGLTTSHQGSYATALC